MPIIRRTIPLYLPSWFYHSAKLIKKVFFGNRKEQLNLWGDRDIEWSFISANIPKGQGKALDLGCAGAHTSLIAALHGFEVTALDLEPHIFPWQHPMIKFMQGDLFKIGLPKDCFDLIINCSTVEHLGLVGRYGVKEKRPDGDLEAMFYLRGLMRPQAVMLITIPVGQDAVFSPLCRVYGRNRLPRLLNGYNIEKEEFWVKDLNNRWVRSKDETALNFKASVYSPDPFKNIYALGCFVLKKTG